jgi:hypothetical protein
LGAFFAVREIAPQIPVPQKNGRYAASPRKRRCASCGLSAPIPCARPAANHAANHRKEFTAKSKKSKVEEGQGRGSKKGGKKSKNSFGFFDFTVKILNDFIYARPDRWRTA